MGKIYKQNCKLCGKYYEGFGKYFCSYKCKYEDNKGKSISEETKKKISEAEKGKPKTEEWKKNIGLAHLGKKREPFSEEWRKNISLANTGKKRTEESKKLMSKNNSRFWLGKKKPPMPLKDRKKISDALKGKPKSIEHRKKLSGKNGSNWIDGRTPQNIKIRNSIEYRLWRESTFARDGFTCRKCKNNSGGNLNAHHILNFNKYPELRFAIDNGITFCKEHHKEFHKLYGKENNNQEQINEFLNNK